jgi:hypothetical protein
MRSDFFNRLEMSAGLALARLAVEETYYRLLPPDEAELGQIIRQPAQEAGLDPTSRELLDVTLDWVARLPVLLVATFRPEFQQAWGGQPHVTTLALNRLGGRDGAALVERLAGNADLARETIDEIVERADCVPLFVEELTKAVVESGERANRVAAVLAASQSPTPEIPATLHASLIARLDRLGPIAPHASTQRNLASGRMPPTVLRRALPHRQGGRSSSPPPR